MSDVEGSVSNDDLDEPGFVRLSAVNGSRDIDMIDADLVAEEPHAQSPSHLNGDTRPGSNGYLGPTVADGQGQPKARRKFIIAVDFGTTTSSIAFVCIDPDTPEDLIHPHAIQCIDHYPDKPNGVPAGAHADNATVPTELWYETRSVAARTNRIGTVALNTQIDDGYDSPLDDGAPAPASNSDREDQETQPDEKQAPIKQSPVWGYGVQWQVALADSEESGPIHMSRFKLLLDEGKETEVLRQAAVANLVKLKAASCAKGPVDVISDYLKPLFKHARNRLIISHDLQDDDVVQFVLCVPVMWTEKACRVMQAAMMSAIEASQLGRLENGGIKDLFIVSEPEAAAAWALSESHYASRIFPGETFLVLDCGGGTVDVITYQLIHTDPIRVREVVAAAGASCGSSLLNDKFCKFLTDRLKGATLRLDVPRPIQIQSAVIEWENWQKRKIDVTDARAALDPVRIPGLEWDGNRRLEKNRLLVSYKEMKDVFKGCLRKVTELMREQLNQAREARDGEQDTRGFAVQKVILIGGFSDSPSLQHHLANALSGERNLLGEPIELMLPRYVDSAVARGAVLRALNKEHGPTRISRTSYGILRDDRYDKEDPRHRGLRGRRDKADGELYIKDTIHWVILNGDALLANSVFRIPRRHVFKRNWSRLLALECLWVSGERHASGYRKSHAENRGAEQLGQIEVDLTELKTQPSGYLKTESNEDGVLHTFWEIEFDLCLIIDGRNLRFEARSPEDPQEVKSSQSFSIAASFLPGTA